MAILTCNKTIIYYKSESEHTSSQKGYLCYNICIISISDSLSDQATKISALNIERLYSAINCPKEFENDVLNSSCATRV